MQILAGDKFYELVVIAGLGDARDHGFASLLDLGGDESAAEKVDCLEAFRFDQELLLASAGCLDVNGRP